jgi:hypothetical protein
MGGDAEDAPVLQMTGNSSTCALTPSTSSRRESDTSARPSIRPPRKPWTIAPRVSPRRVDVHTDGIAHEPVKHIGPSYVGVEVLRV